MSKRLIRIFLCIMMGMWGGRAFACDCEMPSTLETSLEGATYAFVGKCVMSKTNWMSGGMKYGFEISESWKRRVDSFMIVNTPFEKECGVRFEEGKSYLVFVEKKFTHKTNRCLGTQALDYVDIQELGESRSPAPSSLINPMIWTLTGLTVLGIFAVGFVILRRNKNTA